MPNKNLAQIFSIFGTAEVLQIIMQGCCKEKKNKKIKTLTGAPLSASSPVATVVTLPPRARRRRVDPALLPTSLAPLGV